MCGWCAKQNYVDHFRYLGAMTRMLFQTDVTCSCSGMVIVRVESLNNEKWWPGFGAAMWYTTLSGTSLWDGTSFPSTTLQGNWRHHYATYSADWTCSFPPTNSETIGASYSGAGFLPVTSPSTIQTSCTPGSTSPSNPPCLGPVTEFSSGLPADLLELTFVGGIDPSSYSPMTTFNGSFDYNSYDDGSGHNQTWSESIDGDYPFSTELSEVATRVQDRSFPGTYTSGYDVYGEYFDASGGWTTFSSSIGIPDYSANGIGSSFLASYWWWPNALFWLDGAAPASAVACNPQAFAGTAGDKTYATRTKFKIDTGSADTTYFIAKAHVVADPFGAAQTLADATVIDSGTLTVGDELEIPFPTDDSDFVSTPLDHGTNTGQDVLTFGMICFCILGETSAAWSTRTGIPIS